MTEDPEQALQRLAEGLARLQTTAHEASPRIRSSLRSLQEFQTAARKASPHIQSGLRSLQAVREAWPRFESSLRFNLRFTFWLLQQIESAERNPRHKKARPWLALRNCTPRRAAEVIPYLVMIFEGDLNVPARKGRPSRVTDKTAELLEQLEKRIARTGELPTTAAKRLLRERGAKGDLKGRADLLVRLLKQKQRF